MNAYIEALWNHRADIAQWIVSALAATTFAVHALQRLAAAFARLAARTSTKTDDEVAMRLAGILAWCDSSLMALARWLPRVGVSARKPWTEAERQQRTSGGPNAGP